MSMLINVAYVFFFLQTVHFLMPKYLVVSHADLRAQDVVYNVTVSIISLWTDIKKEKSNIGNKQVQSVEFTTKTCCFWFTDLNNIIIILRGIVLFKRIHQCYSVVWYVWSTNLAKNRPLSLKEAVWRIATDLPGLFPNLCFIRLLQTASNKTLYYKLHFFLSYYLREKVKEPLFIAAITSVTTHMATGVKYKWMMCCNQ